MIILSYCSRKLIIFVIFKKINNSKLEIGHETGSIIFAVKLSGTNLRQRVRNPCAKFLNFSFIKITEIVVYNPLHFFLSRSSNSVVFATEIQRKLWFIIDQTIIFLKMQLKHLFVWKTLNRMHQNGNNWLIYASEEKIRSISNMKKSGNCKTM